MKQLTGCYPEEKTMRQTIAAQEMTFTVPRRLAGRKLVLVDAGEIARLRKQVAALEDAVAKIQRGEKAWREGRTRAVSTLAELRRG